MKKYIYSAFISFFAFAACKKSSFSELKADLSSNQCNVDVRNYIDGIPVEAIKIVESHVSQTIAQFNSQEFYIVITGRTGVLFSSILRIKKINRDNWIELPFSTMHYVLPAFKDGDNKGHLRREKIIQKIFHSRITDRGDRDIVFVRYLLGGGTISKFFKRYVQHQSLKANSKNINFRFFYSKTPHTKYYLEDYYKVDDLFDFFRSATAVSSFEAIEEPKLGTYLDYLYGESSPEINRQLFERETIDFFWDSQNVDSKLSQKKSGECYKYLDAKVSKILAI